MLDPARANSKSILSIKRKYTPPFLPCSPNLTLFVLPLVRTGATHHFIIIVPFCSYPTLLLASLPPRAGHLASNYTFLLTRLAPQTTRLRLKQLKKPRSRSFLALLLASLKQLGCASDI
jgi:hypothetical protein